MSRRSHPPLPDFTHIPIAAYAVDPEGRFLACNALALKLLGSSDGEQPEPRLQQLLVEAQSFERLTAEALRCQEQGETPRKHKLRLAVEGREVVVEHYLEPYRDPASNELVGYVGCMTDITDEHASSEQSEALQRKVEELTFDIGRILHANTSTLIMVNQTLSAAASALPDNPAESDDDSEDLDEVVARGASSLADALEKLLRAGEAERREKALDAESWETLASQVRILRDYERLVPVAEIRNATLRSSAAGISRVCSAIEAGWLPREPVRRVLQLARGLERLTCARDVATTRAAVVQMDFTLRALRDFITSEVRISERPKRIAVATLIQEAIKQLADFSQASNVEIVWRDREHDIEVLGDERDLVRALSNVLHNAIKYSWQRDRSKSPWVAIRTSEEDGIVSIEFESWGVPITEKELEESLVYQMGYRGKWSTDRGRLGTGIGLTDSKRVAESMGGHIAVESKPAQPTSLSPGDREYYQVPFLTRVTLQLPTAV